MLCIVAQQERVQGISFIIRYVYIHMHIYIYIYIYIYICLNFVSVLAIEETKSPNICASRTLEDAVKTLTVYIQYAYFANDTHSMNIKAVYHNHVQRLSMLCIAAIKTSR